jgi:hypothetical protein
MQTLLDTALYLSDKGLAVVPIIKGQKRPALPEWQSHKRSRDDLQSIFENSNGTIGGIGVVTGHLSGNRCVLDFDGEGWAGAFDYLTDCWPDMAQTVTVKTGSGRRHLWIHIPDLPADFTHEEFARPDLNAVIDLRGNRTQAVVPPSLHPSGNRYEWANDNSDFIAVPFAEITRWLREWAGDKATRTGNGDGDLQPGMRHDYLLKVAGSLRRQGMTAVEMLPVLRSVNEQRCKPPKSDEELVHIANSVQKYKPAALGAAPAPKRPSTIPKSADLIGFLTEHGYQFRMNECDDSLECNKQRMSDVLRAEVRAVLRDAGYRKHLLAAEDAYLAEAGRHKYHPVREYLDSLEWDGAAWIETLASYFTNAQGVFPVYLRKWLIGAVARAYEGCQNATLVLDGTQGIGKSHFVKWLCPIPGMYLDLGINPENKDHQIILISKWIWEVGELTSTIRRADVDALKGFLSREWVTVRPPYGHYDIVKPALACFIGTVNNSSGFLSDPTGSRRFWACTLEGIEWGYTGLNKHDVWAEAAAAYHNGEPWRLSADEAQRTRVINEQYEIGDPVEAFLQKCFTITSNPTDWVATVDLLTTMQEAGLQGNTRSNSMALAATMKRLGLDKSRWDNKMGYRGVRK